MSATTNYVCIAVVAPYYKRNNIEGDVYHIPALPGTNSKTGNLLLVNLPYLRGPINVAYLNRKGGIRGFFKGGIRSA